MSEKLEEVEILIPSQYSLGHVPDIQFLPNVRTALDNLKDWGFTEVTHKVLTSKLTVRQKQNALELLSNLSQLKGMLWSLAQLFVLWQKAVRNKLGYDGNQICNTGKQHLLCMDRWLIRSLLMAFNIFENGFVYSIKHDPHNRNVKGIRDSWKGLYTGCSLDDFQDTGTRAKGSVWPERYTSKVRQFVDQNLLPKVKIKNRIESARQAFEDMRSTFMKWKTEFLKEDESQIMNMLEYTKATIPYENEIPTLSPYYSDQHWEILYNNCICKPDEALGKLKNPKTSPRVAVRNYFDKYDMNGSLKKSQSNRKVAATSSSLVPPPSDATAFTSKSTSHSSAATASTSNSSQTSSSYKKEHIGPSLSDIRPSSAATASTSQDTFQSSSAGDESRRIEPVPSGDEPKYSKYIECLYSGKCFENLPFELHHGWPQLGHDKKLQAAEFAKTQLKSAKFDDIFDDSDEEEMDVGESNLWKDRLRKFRSHPEQTMEWTVLSNLPYCPSIDFAFMNNGEYGICPLCSPSNSRWHQTIDLEPSQISLLKLEFCSIKHKSNRLSAVQMLNHLKTGHKCILGRGIILYCKELYKLRSHGGGKLVRLCATVIVYLTYSNIICGTS
jgi:hypothetical protein